MELSSFIICEDIRHEEGNKISLMGVYGDSINFFQNSEIKSAFPRKKKLGFLIKLKNLTPIEKTETRFLILESKLNGEKENSPFKIEIKSILGSELNVVVILENFEFKNKGHLSFGIRLQNEKLQNISYMDDAYLLEVSELDKSKKALV